MSGSPARLRSSRTLADRLWSPAFYVHAVRRAYVRICNMPVPRWVNAVADNKRTVGVAVSFATALVTGPAVMLATGFGDVPVTAATGPAPRLVAASRPHLIAGDAAPLEHAMRLQSQSSAQLESAPQAGRLNMAPPVPVVHHSTPVVAKPKTPTVVPVYSGGGAGGSLGACIRQRENGGSYAWGTGDGGGAYQFEPGTWAAYAPSGAWGSASPAQQDAAFLAVVRAGPQAVYDAWESDGCPQSFGLTAAIKGISNPQGGVTLVAYEVSSVNARLDTRLADATSPFGLPVSMPSISPAVARELSSGSLNIPSTAQIKASVAWLAAQAQAAARAKAQAKAAALAAAKISASGAGGYPLRGISGLVVGRIDEGQDFCGSGPIYGIATGTIDEVWGPGWPGNGVYIEEHLTSGSHAGQYVYFAESITPRVSVGESVSSLTVIGDMYNSPVCIEIGWGSGIPETPLGHPGYVDGVPTAAGYSFAAFLRTL